MLQKVDSADQAMMTLALQCRSTGSESSPHKIPTLDVLNTGFTLTDPRRRIVHNEGRQLRHGYNAASVAWNLAQREDVESICWWNESGKRVSDDGETFHGANYGVRWNRHNALQEAMDTLDADEDSRRAWIPIWHLSNDGGDYGRKGKDVPCCLGFGLRIQDERLHMNTVWRSCAVIGVMPYDIFLMTTLQELVADQMGLPLGQYHHFALSAHVYERELPWLEKCAEWWQDNYHSVPEGMEPYDRSLTEATRLWPPTMDAAMRGKTDDEDGDDVLQHMLRQGALDVIVKGAPALRN